MRPIDLTPTDMRQGARAPMRTGAIPYILVGALVAVLAGVALLVTTGNQVTERRCRRQATGATAGAVRAVPDLARTAAGDRLKPGR